MGGAGRIAGALRLPAFTGAKGSTPYHPREAKYTTMQIPRPTDEDKTRFRDAVPGDPRIAIKPLFGNLGAFVNGHMFMGLPGSDIGVKLAPADVERLRAIDEAGPFGPTGRPMGGYVSSRDLTVPTGMPSVAATSVNGRPRK